MTEIYGYTGSNRHKIRIDESTRAMLTVDYAHHEIHGGSSYTVGFSNTESGDDERSGIYFVTPVTPKECHPTFTFSASAAAEFFICEAPTLAADEGTHTVAVHNRNRNSTNTTTMRDNDNPAVVGYVTTLVEEDFDVTFAQGTVLRYAILQSGAGPFTAGGVSRGSQEYVLKYNTKYIAYIQNIGANSNIHNIQLDWYEHTALTS